MNWRYSENDGREYFGNTAPSYFEHNRRTATRRTLPDVLPADFEPPRFQIREGIIIEEGAP